MIWLAVFRKLYNHRYQPRTITCRNFANYYLTSLNDLQSNNFEPVFNSSSVNEAWSFLKSILKKCIDGHAPIIRDCLAPRPLSFDENVRAKEGGKETTGETCFACHLYPSHGPLRFITSHSFHAHLCHAKNEAPEEEAGVNQYLSVNLKSMAIQYFPGLVQP